MHDPTIFAVSTGRRRAIVSWRDLVRDRPAHARDEDDAAAVPEARHLAARGLGGEEDAVDVYVHDL